MQITLKIDVSKAGVKLYIFRFVIRCTIYFASSCAIFQSRDHFANQCRMKRRELYLTAITIRGPYVHRSSRICSQRRNIHIARE